MFLTNPCYFFERRAVFLSKILQLEQEIDLSLSP